MFKLLKRQPWTCARCLRKQQRLKGERNNSTAAAAAAGPASTLALNLDYMPAEHGRPNISQDDYATRKIFDSKPFWHEFSHQSVASGQRGGLIGNKYLTTPAGFHDFAQNTLRKCRRIVEKVLLASTIEEYRHMARDLDRLSDLLCRVIDLSDFMRATHPDRKFVEAANHAYMLMFQYMNILNTTTGLNEQLGKALSMPEVTSHWTEEEKVVAEILMKDFAKSGIDLPTKQREDFVDLSSEISQVGTHFVNGMELANDRVTLSLNQMQGVDPTIVKKYSSWNKAVIPAYSSDGRVVMSTAHDEEARRAIYMADRTASRTSIRRLERLMVKRAELAKLTGYSSFARMTLVDKMAKTPEAVNNFLTSLNTSNRGQVQLELDKLLAIKNPLNPSANHLQPWDHAYYLNQLNRINQTKNLRTSKSRLREMLPSFLSLGTVISGLSRLFDRLYGVRLVPRSPPPGEVWNPDVRRLDVVSESEGHIAVIYCDLFSRAGKSPNPAHFTLVCSREISAEEAEETRNSGEHLNDGMPTGLFENPQTGKKSHRQLPTIALICDFPTPAPSSSAEPALLTLHNLTTLFHEMGHAIHSILGRTSMQGISGTRCATDFAELPSILMEYFAVDPSVLRMFARHWESDAPLSEEMIESLTREQKGKAGRTGGWDNEHQILMALLDQAYHSENVVAGAGREKFDSTAVYQEIWNQYGSVPEPRGTAWQAFFGHLYGYGATYYSYLFDRAIARQVWRAVFRDGKDGGSIDREAGERFKGEVLRWGGGRDPWLCLEGLMGEGRGILAEGGEMAMLEVGKWGVGAGTEGAM